MAIIGAHNERMLACLGKTEVTDLKTTDEEMESETEHREVPKEGAVVKRIYGRKRWHRGRKEAAGRCGEPKELNREDC
jgi:hypothetical protein